MDTDAEAALIADEVSRLAQATLRAIQRITATTPDPAAAHAALIAVSTALLAQVVETDAAPIVATVNEIWRQRGLRLERVH